MPDVTTEIRFYHLERSRLEDALPLLLQKSLAGGRRAVVRTGSPERTEMLNQHLWTFDPGSFLPHGSRKDGDAALQPVWLTEEEENPNNADVLFLCDGMNCEKPESFSLICALFDGNDPELLETARAQWKAWKDTGPALTYWQQGAGGWEKKA